MRTWMTPNTDIFQAVGCFPGNIGIVWRTLFCITPESNCFRSNHSDVLKTHSDTYVTEYFFKYNCRPKTKLQACDVTKNITPSQVLSSKPCNFFKKRYFFKFLLMTVSSYSHLRCQSSYPLSCASLVELFKLVDELRDFNSICWTNAASNSCSMVASINSPCDTSKIFSSSSAL